MEIHPRDAVGVFYLPQTTGQAIIYISLYNNPKINYNQSNNKIVFFTFFNFSDAVVNIGLFFASINLLGYIFDGFIWYFMFYIAKPAMI